MAQNQPDVGQFVGMATEALKQAGSRLDKHDTLIADAQRDLADLKTEVREKFAGKVMLAAAIPGVCQLIIYLFKS